MENERGYFEQFLREKTDQFELVAGRKIWSSIYNNIHPSRKWPSVSVCLLMLTFLFLIGHLNAPEIVSSEISTSAVTLADKNSASSRGGGKNPSLNSTAIANTKEFFEKTNLELVKEKGSAYTKVNKNTIQTLTEKQSSIVTRVSTKSNTRVEPNRKKISEAIAAEFRSVAGTTKNNDGRTSLFAATERSSEQQTDLNQSTGNNQVGQHTQQRPINSANPNSTAADNPVAQSSGQQTSRSGSELQEETADIAHAAGNKENSLIATPQKSDIINYQNTSSLSQEASHREKDWMEHDILYNRKKIKPWKGKLEWQAHIATGVAYRTLSDNTPEKVRAAESATGNNPERNLSLNNAVRQSPSFGIEAGYLLKYPLLKHIRVKLGAQLNYQQYNINAFENHHPIGTSLLLSDDETGDVMNVYKTTSLSSLNGVEAVRLHNNSFQFSIPIGLDARIAGNESLQWFAGASIQPSFVISARNYLLSADKRYYVKDNSLLNKAGLYAAFETYLSFSRGNYSWQLGPQFRTNLLSTNTRLYNVLEHLNGLGLKAGFTKKF